MTSVACAVFLWESAASSFLVPPSSLSHGDPKGTRASHSSPPDPQPHSTWLHRLPKTPVPFRGTNLLPFRFCHPELIVAQQEGPHGLADLGLDAPVVDKAQQLLLLVTLWWGAGGEQRVCLVNREFGADSVTQFFFSDPALRKPGRNEQSLMYPIPTTM